MPPAAGWLSMPGRLTPLGYRTLTRIMQVIREEMDTIA